MDTKITDIRLLNRLLTTPFKWLLQITITVASFHCNLDCSHQPKPWAVVSKFFTFDSQTKAPLLRFFHRRPSTQPQQTVFFSLVSVFPCWEHSAHLSPEKLCSSQLPWSPSAFPIALSQPSPAPAGTLLYLPTPCPSCL